MTRTTKCTRSQPRPSFSRACAWLALLAWLGGVAAARAVSGPFSVAPLHAAVVQPAEMDAADEHADEEHEPILQTVARFVNFALLAGGLFVMLRGPVSTYLTDRGAQVRRNLAQARLTTAEAEQQLVGIEAQLRALPAELEALKARGLEEVGAEETRLRESTEAARQRLVDQTRRDMDTQLRIAKRDLTHRVAELAVGEATQRIKEQLDDADQLRLIDRYVGQVRVQ